MTKRSDGFGKPPTRQQWKPGRSGNPKGCPRKPKNLFEVSAKMLQEPVRARSTGGTEEKLSLVEAGLLRMCQKGLRNDRAALFEVMRIILSILPATQTAKQKDVIESKKLDEKFCKMLGITPDGKVIDDDDDWDK